jgi:hypothetical protein
MKRMLLSVAVAALLVGGVLSGSALAQSPYHHHHHRGPGYGGYGAYGGARCYPGVGVGYRGPFVPYNVYRPTTVPYGAGYSGGWQPYGRFDYQQPRLGLYVGF